MSAGWIKLPRALLGELPGLPATATKVYVVLLLRARATGADQGMVRGSLVDLAADAGLSRTALGRALGELARRGWIRLRRGANQYAVSTIMVDPMVDRCSTTKWTSTGASSSAGRGSSTAANLRSISDIRAPETEEKKETEERVVPLGRYFAQAERMVRLVGGES